VRDVKVAGLEVGVSIDDAMKTYVEKHPPKDMDSKQGGSILEIGRAIMHEVRGSVEESGE